MMSTEQSGSISLEEYHRRIEWAIKELPAVLEQAERGAQALADEIIPKFLDPGRSAKDADGVL